MIIYNCNKGVGHKGGKEMEDEMNQTEALVEKTEENQTRKILDIMEHSGDLQEAIAKVRDLLKK